MERRLAALMAADVVGYSARMAAAEAATLQSLADLRVVLERRVEEGGGRLFAVAGDGFLVEFASPVAAVRAAFEIQRDLAARRRRDPATLELRIGLHLADVFVRGDDLLGDGVNVASRIEGVAAPGSVTVSQQIFDQVKRAAYLTFENLGEHRLKNIPDPLRLYRVVGEQDAHSYISAAPDAPARATDVPVPPLDKPSIVVPPFVNMSGDPEQDYFADGLSEDLITDLARFKALFVVSRNASFVYRGRDIDPRRVGREVGVRYCLEGSVRKLGDRVRITAQLVDTGSSEHVWADRFDSALHDLFDLQDEITARIVATIVGRVEARDAAVARRKRPGDLDAYDCLLRGLEYHRLGGVTREDAEQAVAWFERAIEKDPAVRSRPCMACLRHREQGRVAWNQLVGGRGRLHRNCRARTGTGRERSRSASHHGSDQPRVSELCQGGATFPARHRAQSKSCLPRCAHRRVLQHAERARKGDGDTGSLQAPRSFSSGLLPGGQGG